jgi:flagellar hook-associated protein 3 FlgL
MMRISTSWTYQQSLNTMLNQQAALAATQNQVSSGKRISVASDDPTGAAQAVTLSHILASNTQYSSNIDSATTRLSTETNALSSVTSLLNSANDLGLQAINGALSASDRSGIATQLTQIRDALVQQANTTDGNGTSLFAGTSTTSSPFTLNADGTVTYHGNDTQSFTSVGDNAAQIANSDAGSAIFMNIPAGNGSFVSSAGASNTGTLVVGGNAVSDANAWSAATAAGPINDTITFGANGAYTVTDASGNPVNDASGNPITGTYNNGDSISINGASITLTGTPAAGDTVSLQSGGAQNTQDVFSTLNNMINALQSGSNTTALNNTLNRQLESINQALNTVGSTQVAVGGRLNTLQAQQTSYANLNVTYQSALSDVQNVDMATAISNLSLQSTALQASQQVFAKVQSLSLFNYIQG